MFTSSGAVGEPAEATTPGRGPDAAEGRGCAERRERLAAALVAAREGDRHGLDELVRELTPVLWHVARAQGLDQQDAVDVVQSTWLALVGALSSIHNPAGLLSWLITVTRREAWRVRAAGRAELPVQTEELVDRPDPGPAVDTRLLTETQRERLWEAVGRLPPRCQELLRIVAFVDRPDYQAISQALGMPIGGIGPTRGRCLDKLRRLLDVDAEEGWWT